MEKKKTLSTHALIRSWRMIKPEHKCFYRLFLCSLLGDLLVVTMSLIMGIGIDDLPSQMGETGIGQLTFSDIKQALLFLVLLLIGCSVPSSVASFIQERTMAALSGKITLRVRKEITKEFKALPISFFDNRQVGDIISRTTTGLSQLSQVLLTGINQFFTPVVTVVAAGLMLFYIESKLTLLVLLLIVGNSIVTTKIANRGKQISEQNQYGLGVLNNRVEEILAGSLVVKTFNQQARAKASIHEVNGKQYDIFKRAQSMSSAVYPIIRFISQLAFIISAVFGAILVLSGGMTIGFLQAYLQHIDQISGPISAASYVINSIQSAMAAVKGIFEILNETDEIPDLPETKLLEEPKGKMAFKNIQFDYTSDKILMNQVDFSVKLKQTVAIVGPTGAGETTLVNLLMRFYKLDKKGIEFGGCDITKLSRGELRHSSGVVLQDTWLFEGTAAGNVAYGKMDATREQIIEVAKIAQCDHFIRTLPEGYDIVISSENGTLSQGQRQLLAITRVILANPPVVILDEATSSVDIRTEALIQQAVEAVTKDRTSLIVIHRLSTIENAGVVLVMKNDGIVEKGTRSELLQAPTLYANLYNSQFQVAWPKERGTKVKNTLASRSKHV